MPETSSPKKKRRGGPRRKTGCYTCKSRHSRCDEKKPVCSNCERLKLDCKQYDFIVPSDYRNTLESGNTIPTLRANVRSSSVSSQPFETPASTWEVFRPHMTGIDLATDESPSTDTLGSVNLITPATTADESSPATAVILTAETVFLLQTYLRTVATWMDLMDHNSTYQLSIPRETLKSPLLYHCTCAFTAKHLALSNFPHNSSWDPIAQHHYGLALRLLITALNTPSHPHALTATILLSSYEILGAIASEYHRRHFLGLAMLIKSRGITAQSKGIDRANFWIYVRHEIGFAIATEKPLILDPNGWNVSWREGETREDVLGNHVFWILARVINLVFGKGGTAEAGKQKREEFLQELEEWRTGLSHAFIGIPYGEEDEDGFRKVYFTVTAAAAAAFWYHVIHILLYAEPTLQHESYGPRIQDQAMRITNIAISKFPDSLRVWATHGLYYAAKHIQGLSRKARIWTILNDIEIQSGYHTRSIVKKLQGLVEHDSHIT